MSAGGQMTAAALRRERIRGRIAGAAGALAVALSLAAVLLATAGGDQPARPGAVPTRAVQLRDVEAHASSLLNASLLRAVSLLLVIPLALHLDTAIRARGAAAPRLARWLGPIGLVLLGAATVLGHVALRDVAATFADGPPTLARADALVDGDTALRAVFWFERVAFLAFGSWLVLASLWAMRCDLLTRLLGAWGIGAGVASIFLPIGSALFLGWLGSVSLLVVGYWPGGRPPTWRDGRPAPWAAGGRRP